MLIAALGSSFAAGPTIEPVADRVAMRSARNYPRLLAGMLGADLVDLTVSGATTATILDTPQVIAPHVRFPPQIDGLPPDTDLVTVTAGGNDLRFIGSMLFTAWSRHQPDGPMARMLAGEYGGGVQVPTDEAVDGVGAGLARVAGAVHAKAPAARVLFVDYLTVLDVDSRSDLVAFDEGELGLFRALQAGLENAYRRAADGSGTELVAVSGRSRGHGLGSAEPWINDFIPDPRRTAGSFHPNADGMAAVADLLLAQLA